MELSDLMHEAMETAAEIMRDNESPASLRLQAAKLILDGAEKIAKSEENSSILSRQLF